MRLWRYGAFVGHQDAYMFWLDAIEEKTILPMQISSLGRKQGEYYGERPETDQQKYDTSPFNGLNPLFKHGLHRYIKEVH
jgi:hypothetical protein